MTTETPLSDVSGIGPTRAAQLAKLKLHQVGDVLLNRPKRYEDRREFRHMADAVPEEPAVFQGRVASVQLKRLRQRRQSILEVVMEDDSGQLRCRWWNQPYLASQFQEGTAYLIFGKPKGPGPLTLDQPDLEPADNEEENPIHLHRIVPVYRLTQGLPQRWLRALTWRLITTHGNTPPTPGESPIRPQLEPQQALKMLHFPEDLEETEAARCHFAQEELVRFQLKLQQRRLRFLQKARAPACRNTNQLVSGLLKRLPFSPTEAQKTVLADIRRDLNRPVPMRRLLQGDVGSGKTLVATLAGLMMLESDYDVALMAPTELLALQHHQTLSRWLQPLGLVPALCTGHQKTALSNDTPTFTVGTHALLESGYEPARLGLVVIDEQHRFGVSQRDRLLRKGSYPHLLTMTATPIPRSLGLTVYADLDHSTMDERPGGRGEIKTYVRAPDRLDRIWTFIRQQLEAGRQAYIVYPRIEESDSQQLKSLNSEREAIEARLQPFSVACVHGKLKRETVSEVMEAFRQGDIQALVATSVIEVGVDVPNATVMLIENAERFGLAQLHQLRGRIGRGTHDSHCILVSHESNEEAWQRLRVLESNQDGFAIAESDLRHRGPGEFLGKQQSGLPQFRFADLVRDRRLMGDIRNLIRAHLQIDAILDGLATPGANRAATKPSS